MICREWEKFSEQEAKSVNVNTLKKLIAKISVRCTPSFKICNSRDVQSDLPRKKSYLERDPNLPIRLIIIIYLFDLLCDIKNISKSAHRRFHVRTFLNLTNLVIY